MQVNCFNTISIIQIPGNPVKDNRGFFFLSFFFFPSWERHQKLRHHVRLSHQEIANVGRWGRSHSRVPIGPDKDYWVDIWACVPLDNRETFFQSLSQMILICKCFDCPTLAVAAAIMFPDPAHWQPKWEPRSSDNSLLKTALWSLVSSAGWQEGGDVEGSHKKYVEVRSYHSLLLLCCVIQGFYTRMGNNIVRQDLMFK